MDRADDRDHRLSGRQRTQSVPGSGRRAARLRRPGESDGVCGHELSYDGADRLAEIGDSAASRRFLYDGDALIAEYHENGTLLRRYVHGPGVDNPLVCVSVSDDCFPGANNNDRHFLLSDLRGSVIAYVDAASGAVDLKNVYDVFGRPGANNGGVFSYTGQQYLPA